jgi:uncharacterized protein (TIGR03437 family)
MKRIVQNFTILLALGAIQTGLGQTGIFNSVTVRTPVDGAIFYVDGVPYTSTQVFRWQVGDVHTIRFSTPQTFAQAPNNQPANGPVAPDSGLGIAYAFDPEVTYTPGPPASTGSENQDFPTDSSVNPVTGERVLRIRVWPLLRSIDLTPIRFYRLRIRTYSNGCAPLMDPLNNPLPEACGPVPGYIDVTAASGTCEFRITNGDQWCPEGTTVRFLAVPTVGHAFVSWNTQPGVQAQINGAGYGYAEFTLNNPFHLHATFGPGKFYRLQTEPRGFDIVVDRAILRTRNPEPMVQSLCSEYVNVSVDPPADQLVPVGQGGDNTGQGSYCTVWGFNTTRLLAAPDLQRDDSGRWWAFDKIENTGGGQNSDFVVAGANLSTNSITWKFVRTASVHLMTQPRLDLPLIVNNRTWPAYYFQFGLGREFTFTAPAESVDSLGRRWRFRGWSNGGAATQTIKVTEDMVANGLTLMALYDPMNKLSIETNPPGLPVLVNGQACAHPCVLERLATESVTVAPEMSVTQANVLRLEFDGWTDGGEATRVVNFEPEVRRLVANYKQNYLFTAVSNPTNGADFTFNPASTDGFYPLNTQVTVTAKARNGFKFNQWLGDSAGMFPSTTLTIGGPRSVVAELTTVPYVDPAGVRNAAGTGPQDEGEMGRVAPGSLITVTGVNMTPKEETGPASPQAQTLADLVVRVNNRILPLSFASGTQIGAQLPFDLPEGKHKLTVTRLGQADLTADFEAVRNAPGLFGVPGTESEGVAPHALALKADGTVVSESNPARNGDVVNLLGTGLGPFRVNLPIGFAIPAGNSIALGDTVEVLVGDAVVQPLQVIAATGRVGMASIQVRLGAQFPSGQSTTLRIRVNGKESNAVRLDVR